MVRDDVPDDFGHNAPTLFRQLAVRHITLVGDFLLVVRRYPSGVFCSEILPRRPTE